jgi:hypothetical protein
MRIVLLLRVLGRKQGEASGNGSVRGWLPFEDVIAVGQIIVLAARAWAVRVAVVIQPTQLVDVRHSAAVPHGNSGTLSGVS